MAFSFLKKLFIGEQVTASPNTVLFISLIWIVIVSLLLFWGINQGGLLPGYSQAEIEAINTTSQLPHILKDFLYYPFYLAVYLLRFILEDGVLAARIVSGLSGLLATFSLFYLLRQYASFLLSLAGASFFIFNSWLLSLARIGEHEMSFLALSLGFLAMLMAIRHHLNSFYWKLGFIILGILNLFLPLMPWLILGLAFLIWWRRERYKAYYDVYLMAIGGGLFCLILGIMIWSGFYQAERATLWILWGIPNGALNLPDILSNLGSTFKSLVWQAPNHPAVWLGRLAFLDIFLAVMMPFGIWNLRQRRRVRFLFYGILALGLIASLNQGILTPGLYLLLPVSIFLAVMGIDYLLKSWREYFPINPLARALEVLILIAFINLSFFYQINKYFIAWKQNPETQEIYCYKKEGEIC